MRQRGVDRRRCFFFFLFYSKRFVAWTGFVGNIDGDGIFLIYVSTSGTHTISTLLVAFFQYSDLIW